MMIVTIMMMAQQHALALAAADVRSVQSKWYLS